jgi:hypothetical protein
MRRSLAASRRPTECREKQSGFLQKKIASEVLIFAYVEMMGAKD